jgi:hypothetical protein
MNKGVRTAAIAILAILIVSAGSASAMFYVQSPESKAERIVEIADNAGQRVQDFIDLVYANETVLEMIENATLLDELEGNLTLFDEGTANVTAAYAALGTGDYEGAVANATEALSIFREVYRSIHIILCNSDVKKGQLVDPEGLEEGIERALETVEELQALISTEALIYSNLIEAKGLLTEAKNELLPDNIEDARANLREANILISEVCQYLKEIAKELNPQRIRDYCEGAYQYRERFRERFGQAGTEGFDVDGFLQTHGYQNKDDFMGRFQEMIENAKGTEDIEDLEEIGRTIREMDESLTEEVGLYRARQGQEATVSGNGQPGRGHGGSSSSGQPGFGGGQ